MDRPSPSNPCEPLPGGGLGAWLPRNTEDGSWTLVHPEHGQACHSSVGAWREALERYARPTELRSLAASLGSTRPVRVLDVGCGLGWNTAAAWSEVRAGGGQLDVLGLELSPEVCAWAPRIAELSGPGPWSPLFPSVAAVLARQAAHGGGAAPVPPDLTLELRLGDAREGARALLAQGARFDAIFLDAFSPGVEPDLWSADFLGDLGRLLTSTGRLSTYTVAMGVRASLARAGLRVGEGGRVGAKAGGTLASPSGDVPPLLPRVAAKLARRLERDGGPC